MSVQRVVDILINVKSKMSKRLTKMRREFKLLANVAKRVAIGARRAWANLGRTFQWVGRQLRRVAIIATIFAAHMAQKFVRGIIEAGAEAEMFGKQMLVAFGQVPELAKEAMHWVRRFAERTPHYTQEVVTSFIMLKNLGIKNVKETVTAAGDAASAMMRPITDVAMAFGSLLARTWRRLGVHIDRTGKKAIIMTSRMRKEVENNLASVRKALLEVVQKQFGGMMKEMESTWFGMLRILSSVWWEFKVSIAEAGVFQFVSNGLQEILDRAAELRKTGELEEWAVRISDGMINLAKVFANLYDKVRRVYLGFKITGQRLAAVGATVVIVASKIAKFSLGLVSREVWDQSTVVIKDFQKILEDLKGDIDDTVTEFGKLGTVEGGTYKALQLINKLEGGYKRAKEEVKSLGKELSVVEDRQRGLTELGKAQGSFVNKLVGMTAEERQSAKDIYDIMKRTSKEEFAKNIYLQKTVSESKFLSTLFADHLDAAKELVIQRFTTDEKLREQLRAESGLETALQRRVREINEVVLKEIEVKKLLGEQKDILIEHAELYKGMITGRIPYGLTFPEEPMGPPRPPEPRPQELDLTRMREQIAKRKAWEDLTPRQRAEKQGLTVINTVKMEVSARDIAKEVYNTFIKLVSGVLAKAEQDSAAYNRAMKRGFFEGSAAAEQGEGF